MVATVREILARLDELEATGEPPEPQLSDAYRDFQARYKDDPAGFAAECVRWADGEGLAAYQQELLAALVEHRRVAARGPHGLGKSALAALAVLWFSLTRDSWAQWKVVTTASRWFQLTAYLWPEVRHWARRLDWSKIGRPPFDDRELLKLSLQLSTGAATATSPDTPESIEGAHGAQLFYVFDEAKSIRDDVFDAAEGAFSTGEAYALCISTPGAQAGRFYNIFARGGYEDWLTRFVTLHEAIQAGRINPAWAEARRRQWGEESAVYQTRVLGEFAADAADVVIPLAWVEAAQDRYRDLVEANGDPGPFVAGGLDVGRGGDPSILALRFGDTVLELRRNTKRDVMAVTGLAAGVLEKWRGRMVVDVIGIGAGVVDRLRELGYENIEAFNASERTDRRDASGELGFLNKRAASWWAMREMLDPARGYAVALPDDDELTAELTAPVWNTTSSGLIQVESKDAIRARLGRSTNKADAVIMAFWAEEKGGFFMLPPLRRSAHATRGRDWDAWRRGDDLD